MSRLIELIPIALATAFYIYSLWVLLVQMGFLQLTLIGRGFVFLIVFALAGGVWFLLRELHGIRRALSIFSMALPILYFVAYVIMLLQSL
jgi:hypothetical protein